MNSTISYRPTCMLFFVVIISLFIGCSKSDFLNTKPNQALVVPSSISDLQALLDNTNTMNGSGNIGICPILSEATNDDIYVPNKYYASQNQYAQQEYIWATNPYPSFDLTDWDYPYTAVWYANIALDGLTKINPTSDQVQAYNNVMGSAFFYRSFYFYSLVQVFAPPFDSTTASTTWGLPLRLSSDVNEKLSRATLEKTYQQIINDTKQAISLLPNQAIYVTRPCKGSAYGFLARVYLAIQDYQHAYVYADSSLQISNKLLNYNTLNTTISLPITRNNVENLFNSTLLRTGIYTYNFMDTLFMKTYTSNDLRPSIYFSSNATGNKVKCSYDGTAIFYSGIAIDEMYLIRAEAAARTGNLSQATADINTLCMNRYKTGTFAAYSNFPTTNDALNVILPERRKELVCRGIRSTDLRRLNKNPQTAFTLTRSVNGTTYTLPPNDPRYTWLIPDNVISFNSTMAQNPR